MVRHKRAAGAFVAAVLISSTIFSVSTAASVPAQPEMAPSVTQVGEEIAVDTAIRYTGASQKTISHPGATYVKVHFASMRLAPGDFVTVASPERREVHTYHGDPTAGAALAGDSDFTEHSAGGFAAMSVDGDTAVITLHKVAARPTAIRQLGLRVDSYWRGFTQPEVEAHNPTLFSVCGTDGRRDVVCYRNSHPTEFARSGAVARLLLSGGGACTTWRVGNTNRMLTNNHCMSTQSGVAASEVQFNFQCATCGGNDPGPGTKVSGATMIRTSTGDSGQLDYTLFSVNNFSSIQQFGTLFLETRAARAGERIYIPGHGDARPKRLSIFTESSQTSLCTVGNASANTWNISYSCDTSGGNSGSPVLSADHRVIALHHLGGCPGNQGAKAHMIFQQIQNDIDNG